METDRSAAMKTRPELRPEIETFLVQYEATRLAQQKQLLAALAPLALNCDEIEEAADRMARVDRKALNGLMRPIVKQHIERLKAAEAARSR